MKTPRPRARSYARSRACEKRGFEVASGSRGFMQPVAGPSGSPVEGTSGAPDVEGPSGAPIEGPSGPPKDVNPAQFDPLAEIEDARARRQHREERLETLEKKRNSARINVYLFLALTVILGIFSFFPGPIHGDVSDNPQAQMSPNEAETWIRDGGDVDNYREKIWDGSSNASSAHMNIYIPPPLPDMGSTSAIRVDVTFVSYRNSGSTHFMAGMFDGKCDTFLPPHEDLPKDSWHLSEEDLGPGEQVEFTLSTQPGQKCILIVWVEPVENPGTLATMDVEVAIYWPRMFTIPVGLITFMMAGFAFIGAQKTGKSYKEIKYPEGRPEKKLEEEVLEAAEAEQRGDQLGVPEVETPEDADSVVVDGPSLAEAAASPEQDDTTPATEETAAADSSADEEPAKAENSADAWTDEQLLGAGWSQEQIDAMRNG